MSIINKKVLLKEYILDNFEDELNNFISENSDDFPQYKKPEDIDFRDLMLIMREVHHYQ